MEHPSLPKYQAIFFDLFETLITEYSPHYVPTPSIAERLRVDAQAFADAWRAIEVSRMQGDIPDFSSALHEVCRLLDIPPHMPTIRLLGEERLVVKAKPFQRISGSILHVLRTLREEWDLKVGLISNATAEEVNAWSTCDLAPWFDTAIFSYEVGLAKPDPTIYLLACTRLGVAPNRCLFIGDGGSDELLGAARAGLSPCWATWFLAQWVPPRLSEQAQAKHADYQRLSEPEDITRLLRTTQDIFP